MVAQDFPGRSATAPRRPRLRLVEEAPAEVDEAHADVPRLPGWMSVVVIFGGSAALWAAIFIALR